MSRLLPLALLIVLTLSTACSHTPMAGPSAMPQAEAGAVLVAASGEHARILEPCPYQWLSQIRAPKPRPRGAAWLEAEPPGQTSLARPIAWSVEAPATITPWRPRIAYVTGPAGQFMAQACIPGPICTACVVVLR